MLILLTNDDGVDSEGLILLKEFLSQKHVVWTIAPVRERTYTGQDVNYSETVAAANVNIPNVQRAMLKGFMVTRPGKRIYNDMFIERVDPRGHSYNWIGVNGVSHEAVAGTDFFAVENNHVSITPLDIDVTSNNSVDIFKKHFGTDKDRN